MTLKFEPFEQKMKASIDSLHHELSGLRTGRASAKMLEPLMVEAYGGTMALSGCATVSVPEPRMLLVTVWDRDLAKNVDKAIRESGLGLNPQTEGTSIRVKIPELTEERRKELIKVASKYAENTKIAIRNIRRDILEAAKKLEKEIGKDDVHKLTEKAQKITDDFVSQVDKILAEKEKDIKQI